MRDRDCEDDGRGRTPLNYDWQWDDQTVEVRPPSIWDDEEIEPGVPVRSGADASRSGPSRIRAWVIGLSVVAIAGLVFAVWGQANAGIDQPESASESTQEGTPAEPVTAAGEAEPPTFDATSEPSPTERVETPTDTPSTVELPDLNLPVLDWDPVSALEGLMVNSPGPQRLVPAYSREAFGETWFDYDGNGCDTRNDILRRDLAQLVIREGTFDCVAQSGTLTDPYTGEAFEFLRGSGNAGELHVDHVVSLSDAWRSGAHTWTTDRRLEFANDPMNLIVTFGTTNMSKSGLDASGWMPPLPESHCGFALQVISVKAEYELSVTEFERQALWDGLRTCDVTDRMMVSGESHSR